MYLFDMRRWPAWIVGWLVAVAFALAGSAPVSAQCVPGPPPVKRHGVRYEAFRFPAFDRLPAAARTLNDGLEFPPGCNDALSGADAPLSDVPVSLRALKGVRPRIAVVRSSDPTTALLSDGFPLELKSHPLHRYARLGRPSRLFGCKKTAVVHVRLDSQPRPLFPSPLRTSRGQIVDVVLRAGTKMHTLRKAGMPYLRGDERLVIPGCLNLYGTKIAANTIRAD